MKTPDIVLSFDRGLGEHYEQIDLDVDALQSIVNDNLEREPKSDVLKIHFQYPFIDETANVIRVANYSVFNKEIDCSLQHPDREYPRFSNSEPDAEKVNKRFLHELGHYVDLSGDSFLGLIGAGLRRVKFAAAGGLLTMGSITAASVSQEVMPVDKYAVAYSLLAAGAGATAMQYAGLFRLGPPALKNWAKQQYKSRPEEVFADEFADREFAKLDTPLITLTPRSQS